MTDNVVSMPTPMNVLADKIRSAFHRTERGRFEWIEGTLELAVLLSEARERFPSNTPFSHWIIDAELEDINYNDRAALIHMADNLQLARVVLEETERLSWQLIWEKEIKPRLPSARKMLPEPANISEPPVLAAPAQPIDHPAAPKSPEQIAGQKIAQFTAPAKSKLRDLLKPNAAEVLLTHFKSTRMFATLSQDGRNQKSCVTLLNYLAERCVQPDYPDELFTVSTWTIRLLYPHLPQKLLDQVRGTVSTLVKLHHATLVETERRFVLTPEFGVTDPPLVAFNKAQGIYSAITHAKNGGTFDQSAIHRTTYADGEGKQPVIVRGTQLWPAETGAGYGYEDLRCAHGLADDILKTFDETRNAPLTTRSLKLRHVLSWLPGGYNSTGASLDGTMKALKAVVQAYGADKSDVMRSPSPSLKKLDEA
jgi:hypothetical protein